MGESIEMEAIKPIYMVAECRLRHSDITAVTYAAEPWIPEGLTGLFQSWIWQFQGIKNPKPRIIRISRVWKWVADNPEPRLFERKKPGR